MESPTFDLGSLCSSPLLYAEGEDFLGQPVNTFFDEDNSFDFIDTFEAGLSIAENANEVTGAEKHEKDHFLIRESPLVLDTQQEDCITGKDVINTSEGAETFCEATRSHISPPLSECINTCTNEVSPNTENGDSRTLSKNAEELMQSTGRQDVTEADKTPSKNCDKDRVKTGSENETRANTAIPSAVLPEGLEKNFEQNTYINNDFNEKPTLENFKLLSLDEHATYGNNSHAINAPKSIKATDFKNPHSSPSLALRNAAFRRCVVPKTFYSPFWKPEKSTAGGVHENSLEDGLANAQRNMDILYCCNCKSQRRDSKHIRITMKSRPGLSAACHKDGNQYIDFLKRNSVMKPQGDHRKTHNKAINGEISGHVCNETNINGRWISLPAIRTSFKASRQRACSNREIGTVYPRTLSIASIDGLINKHKGRHFDLVEQQKRYHLKPFK